MRQERLEPLNEGLPEERQRHIESEGIQIDSVVTWFPREEYWNDEVRIRILGMGPKMEGCIVTAVSGEEREYVLNLRYLKKGDTMAARFYSVDPLEVRVQKLSGKE